jgi:ElaB/YqjD/DUF883 family membrane-anchored ribosome-binding protein
MADTVNPDAPESTPETAGEREGVVSARQRFQRLSDEVQHRYRHVSDDVRRGAERASTEIRRGGEVARDRYREASETARVQYDRFRSEAGNVSREVGLYVRDNPGKAVAIAAGLGFLLGLIVRRREPED